MQKVMGKKGMLFHNLVVKFISNGRIAKAVAWLFVLLYRPLKVILGDKVLDIFSEIGAFVGRARAKPLAEKLGINPESAEELGKIQDFEDEIFGVEGEWEKKAESEAIKIERECPFAKILDGEFCRKVIYNFEVNTFRTLNPNYSLEIKGKLLSEGGEGCIFIHRIRKKGRRNGKSETKRL